LYIYPSKFVFFLPFNYTFLVSAFSYFLKKFVVKLSLFKIKFKIQIESFLILEQIIFWNFDILTFWHFEILAFCHIDILWRFLRCEVYFDILTIFDILTFFDKIIIEYIWFLIQKQKNFVKLHFDIFWHLNVKIWQKCQKMSKCQNVFENFRWVINMIMLLILTRFAIKTVLKVFSKKDKNCLSKVKKSCGKKKLIYNI